MAQRNSRMILLLFSLATMFCLVTSDTYGPKRLSCCVEYQKQPIPFNNIKGYKLQSSLEMCHMDAIIFYTIRNIKVCATIKDAWVQKALGFLSEKLKKMTNSKNVMDKPLHHAGFFHKNTTSPNESSE
ncbi:hypothetical protein UPYG_G00294510 [Umbra pygmaea]|uniref:Chemokine interleukin-8-like domain-containing protein n=1 Tax=Umbra pygmaea TaxID=75934 RepID=A0ABD0W5D3_UMBPY